MTDTSINTGQLRAFVERIERLEEEIKAINDDKKDAYSEAKSMGFCTKTLKKIIAERRKDPSQRDEESIMFDLYADALGMVSATQVHVREAAE